MIGSSTIHANFSVDSLAAAKAFYVDKLGFRIVVSRDIMMMLEGSDGTRMNIYEKADHKPWDSTVLGLVVEDVAQAVEELAKHGIDLELLPMTDAHGLAKHPDLGEAAWFRDPAGNWVCISNLGL